MKPATVTTRTKTSTGTRSTQTTTSYDPTYGMPLTVDDQGDTAKTGDETCTKNTYTRNATDWLMRFSSRIETYAVGCATTPKLPDDTISDVTTAYDNQAVGVAPTTTSAGPNPPQTASTAPPTPATSPTTPDAAH